MDEINQQTDSDPALKDSLIGDSEASVKGNADEEEPLPKKSSSDASSSSTLIEALNTNGVTKDSESQLGVTSFHTNDLESPECQEEKTSNDSVWNKPNYEVSVASEGVDNSLEECVVEPKNSEICFSSVERENIDSRAENYSESGVSECQASKKEDFSESIQEMDVSGDNLSKEYSNLSYASKNSECNKCESKKVDTTCGDSQKQEVIDEKEDFSLVMIKDSERISSLSSKSCLDEKGLDNPTKEAQTRLETINSSKQIIKEVKLSDEVETERNLCNFNYDLEKYSNNPSQTSSEISQMTDQQSKETEQLSPKPGIPNEESLTEELIFQESQDKEKSNNNEILKKKEQQSKEIEDYDQRPVIPNENLGKEEQVSYETQKSDNSKIKVHMTDQQSKSMEEQSSKSVLPSEGSQEEMPQEGWNIEKSNKSDVTEFSDLQNKEGEDNPKSTTPHEDLDKQKLVSEKDQLTEKSGNKTETRISEIEDLVETEENGNKEMTEEIEKKDLVEEMGKKEVTEEIGNKDVPEEIGNKEMAEEIGNKEMAEEIGNKEEGTSNSVISDSEIFDLQEEKKSDNVIDYESPKENLAKTDFHESRRLSSDFENKSDNLQDQSSDQTVNSFSTSVELEEENVNKIPSEGNEIMDTELVNCNEIEEVDINENEGDLKGDSRDEELAGDSLDTVGEKSNEDHLIDNRECSETPETPKNAMLIDEEGGNQPGNSEEETITGDTPTQPSADLAKEKEEEVCIIPDDMISGLSILPESKGISHSEDENEQIKALKESNSDLEKPKTRAQDKKGQDSKQRPVRNAAKLAGNKIKSLVESDLVFDEEAPSGRNAEGEMEIQENVNETTQICAQCREVKPCKLLGVQNDNTHYLCSEQCSIAFKAVQMDTEPTEAENTLQEYVRKCSQCHAQITVDETRLFWETMDFCNEDCLGKFQLELGSNCANCKKSVPSTSLGKYCVRFGYDIKQFCSAVCLEEYKKGLKVCSYCQKDISTGVEGFLAPVGTKGQFKDFCTQSCMEKYDRMSSNKPLPDVIEECAVCSNSKPVQVEVELDNKTHKLCSEPCFAAFKFVNNITEGQCDMCRKYFDRSKLPKFSLRLLFYDETLHSFCSKTCMNVYILANRKIVPCNWCKVKKYNFDMIRKISSDGQLSMMCSLNCLMLYQTSVNAVCSRPIRCDFCKKKFVRQPLYHLTMSDATLRNFCSYNCVMSFQNRFPKQKIDVIPGADQLVSPNPTSGPKRLAPKRPQVDSTCVPVISSVQSLASPNGPVSPSGRVTIPRADVNIVPQVSQPLTVQASVAPMPAPPPQVYQQIITKPAPAKQMKNKSVLCKPYSHTKGVSCRPHPCMKETQTDQSLNRKFLIPIPVPIYVPAPMHMFSAPFPVPVPFPLPIPVPIFIPTTRNSAKGIMKEIKKIQEKIPTDPFEAELLMMAEMVAGEKKQDPTDSESEDGNDGDDNGDGTFSPENVDTSNTFGDDMLQIALKMASELEEPAVDMESVLTSNTITTSTQPTVDPNKTLYASDTDDPDQVNVMAMNRGRKRSVRGSRNSTGGTPSKRGRRTSGSVDVPLLPPPEPVPQRTIEVEKPDANMCLKYTFGVNAWRHWVLQKNAELEKAALTNRKIKPFKPELLQLTADELNFSLCLFVKEVRKPNGTEYAPDTIYYLCLGIQQYLFENGRIDNIFTDSYYEKFTDCLDEVAKKFAALYNDSQYIVTRVEEEHLWESKQLGAHSPHVLLSTLMFFNTKHFNLVTVEEHMQLSFSHIMKHWKRNPNTPGVAKVPGSRNVLLRFYPPQSALEANSRKKKVYEQQENEENPLRCPVKLYEFYLSKCPESVKTRNDVFYLLPERSCVPDSPVWYSTMALGKEPLMKMLHRIKMVKEINIALLTS